MCLHEHGFTDLSLSLRGFLHDCTVGSHLLAQNLSKSLNLDFRHEQMSSSVFCFLWVFIYFIFCFVLVWVFFGMGLFVWGFLGGSGFGVFKKGGVIGVWIKRQKQNSVLQERHAEVFCCRGTALCMHCWMFLSVSLLCLWRRGAEE